MQEPMLTVTQQSARQVYETVSDFSNEVAGRLAARLACETRGEVWFTAADRGRYATDASICQSKRSQDRMITLVMDLGRKRQLKSAGSFSGRANVDGYVMPQFGHE